MKCQICGCNKISANGIRLNICWECAEAESIIDEGLDMFDNNINGEKEPVKTAIDKVRFLLKKGWIHKWKQFQVDKRKRKKIFGFL